MMIAAKFASKCAHCGEEIKVGAQIEWTKGVPAVHATCASDYAVDTRTDWTIGALRSEIAKLQSRIAGNRYGVAKGLEALRYHDNRRARGESGILYIGCSPADKHRTWWKFNMRRLRRLTSLLKNHRLPA